MTHSPPGRRAPRARRGVPTAAQWLEVPRWRAPVDTLFVLAVAASSAWLGLVVIPAAASGNAGDTTVADGAHREAASEVAVDEPTPDPSQWFAGPVFTGVPVTPQVEAPAPTEEVQEVVAAPARRAPAARTTAARTTTRSSARVAPAATTTEAAPPTTEAAAVTPEPILTTPTTTSEPTTTTTTTGPTTTETSTPTTTETTTPTTETTTATPPETQTP